MDISIGRYISSIYRHQSIIINKLLEDLNIGSGQYLFLLKISQNHGITQKELCDLIHIDRANTNRAIKKLEELDYIYTAADLTDRRNKRSYLTKSGIKTVALLKERLQSTTQILTTGMSEAEMLDFSSKLEQVEHNIQTAVNHLREDENGN